ncbi:RNA polymerase sigma factor [Marinimicrobium agarilyticum]|uniref:RNA polymerase sigma factor n=1 Tax=Marinimicrobium agarilyticum TaxID=306546 RepID=UPI00041749BF|nr:sigma-70 family RNA polymerase sigma factor [Marinimicrobium agarilyticum]
MSPGQDPLSDAGLIARVITQRDPHAFRQLVLRHQSAVRRWARRLSRGNEAAADDLAQDVFIRVYRALPTYRGEARFSTWLYRITFNTAVSQKRLAREQWQMVNLEEAEPELDHSEQPLQATEVRRDLEAAMAALSDPQQWALRLNLEEGLSHQEVAEVMGLPLGTVKTHILRGKRALQARLSPWQETQP